MIEVEDAQRLLLAEVSALEAEETPLDRALGRVLAEPVYADRDVPAADLSTMDGFALRSADASLPGARLRIGGEVRAGQRPPSTELGAREATRIYTGALLPPGADAVVMVERTRESESESGTAVEILDRVQPRENVRARGEELAQGDVVLRDGSRIRAAELAALAAVGRSQVRTVRPPRVSVLSTGDELVPRSAAPEAHQIRNSNSHALLAQLSELGIAGVDLGIVSDEPARLSEALRTGLAGDVLLVTGGVSVGRYDFVRNSLVALGMRVLFHGVAVRPGKPLLAGRLGSSLIVGLPGNPVSAFTAFAIFVAPVLRKLQGIRDPRSIELRCELGASLTGRPGRTTYQLARVTAVDGRLLARPVRNTGSGDVTSLARANAFLIVPPGAEALPAGAEARAVLWRDADLAEPERERGTLLA